MKRMLFTGLLACFTLVTIAGGKYPSWLEGNWTGIGFQPGDLKNWQVDLTVQDGFIDISYPDVGEGCSGNWQLADKKKNVYHFTEKIVEGDCDPIVEVYITRISADAISVAYYIPDAMEGVIAHTVLERE